MNRLRLSSIGLPAVGDGVVGVGEGVGVGVVGVVGAGSIVGVGAGIIGVGAVGGGGVAQPAKTSITAMVITIGTKIIFFTYLPPAFIVGCHSCNGNSTS